MYKSLRLTLAAAMACLLCMAGYTAHLNRGAVADSKVAV